ncbi:MAG TPA: DUF4418 family protein [Acetivibrio sp.]|uniref:DUF4418 family protein n=1 Tax=Acetivibrio sp. TaxID=1872092 RepID=UPI002BD681F1|nr:DUF4418 family protein [Acetivibrio sp.]HOM02795.1 DUF4418 family protein [Acetivibrio sp.]
MKNKVFLGIVYLVFGVLLAVGPYLIFPVCKASMMAMRCQNTAKAELVLGILTIAVGVLMLLIKNRKFRIGLNIAAIPIGILAFLFPNNITGVCSKVHMTCRSLTLPVLSLIGIALVVFAGINTVYLWKFESKGEIYDGICIDFK